MTNSYIYIYRNYGDENANAWANFTKEDFEKCFLNNFKELEK